MQNGRDKFESFYKPFNSIDLIGIRFNLDVEIDEILDNYTINQPTTINILSDSTNNGTVNTPEMINLDKNVTMTFNILQGTLTVTALVPVLLHNIQVYYASTKSGQARVHSYHVSDS